MQSAELKLTYLDTGDVIATSGDGITVSNVCDGTPKNATITGFLNGKPITYNAREVTGSTLPHIAVIDILNSAFEGTSVTKDTYFYGSGGGTSGKKLTELFSTTFGDGNNSTYNSKELSDMYNVTYIWDAATGAFRYKQ